jgi:hypothetical protein
VGLKEGLGAAATMVSFCFFSVFFAADSQLQRATARHRVIIMGFKANNFSI